MDTLHEQTLRHSNVHTLDELPDASLRLLAAMAVVGTRTPLAILATIAGVTDSSSALDDLVEAGFVAWFPQGLTEPVGINSEALRDAVYRSLPVSLRRTMHLAAAEQISGVHGFRHALLGKRRRDPELAAQLEDEATRYRRAADTQRAGTLLLWSAEVSATADERERRLLKAARWGMNMPAAAWASALGQRLTPLDPSVERNLFLGHLAHRESRYEAARTLFRQARDLASDQTARARVAVELAMANLYADTGDLKAQEETALSLLVHERPTDDPWQWAVYFAADAHGRTHQSAHAALSRLDSLASDLQGAGQPVRPILRWARGMWLAQSGRPIEAISELQRALQSHDGPVEPVLPLSHAYLGFAYFQIGDWRAAQREAREAIRVAEAGNNPRECIPAVALLAAVCSLSGDWDAAVAHVDRVIKDHGSLGPTHYAVFPALASATLAYARMEPSRVLSALAPVTAQPALFALHMWWWGPLYVSALIDTGQFALARAILTALRAPFEPRGLLAVVTSCLEARLAIAEGDSDQATDLMARALKEPTAEEWPFGLANLEYDYARLLLITRRRRLAIKWLLSAHARYVDLDARPFAQRCLDLLSELGAQPYWAGADDYSGVGAGSVRSPAALTPQQRQIARLAAEGMTNQQIARAVFLSAKTVEYHLGNVFVTLGITSRRQLAARLDALTVDHAEQLVREGSVEWPS